MVVIWQNQRMICSLNVRGSHFVLEKHWTVVDEELFAFRYSPSLKARQGLASKPKY